METTLEFIGDRQLDGRRTQLATGYMKHSFAYGSTFYQSWLQVLWHQPRNPTPPTLRPTPYTCTRHPTPETMADQTSPPGQVQVW